MESKDLTTTQAKTVGDRIRPMLRYIGALRDRMTRRGFELDDLLYQETCEAFDVLHRINVRLHYLSCKSGVCMGERE